MKLKIDEISKSFDKKVIFDKASYTFEKGKIYGLLGKNGAGKTTLFNCISKNLLLDSGQILLEDEAQSVADYDNTQIGYVYTMPHLPAFMTAYEFVKYFIDIHADYLSNPKSPARYLLDIGIEKQDHHLLLKDYSHGMQNKVQLLVTLLTQPPVLLLDEPLTSFDVVAAHEIKNLLIEMKISSIIIFSTHILQLAQDLCDEIVLLHHQKLRAIDAADIRTAGFEDEIIQILSDKKDV